jgi:hypothetical protein
VFKFKSCFALISGSLSLVWAKCNIHCRCHIKRRWNVQNGPNMLCLQFWLGNVLRATTAYTFNISTSKSVPTTDCFAHSDFKICSSQQHFFLTFSTSKNVSKIACFGHFGLQKMFRGTEACIFLNKYTGQQSFEAKVLLAFWLGNAFRPTAACTFSTFQLPGSRCFQHVYFQNLFRALKARNFDLIIYWRIRPGRGIK